MQDRSARIRYQDIVTDSSPSSAGRFGYADDTAILCVGNSLDETTAEASHHETDEHETWPLPSAMRRAVCACVIPVLLYAAEAWYPGPKSPRWTKPSKEGPSGIGNLVKKMSKALYTSLRAILPVWRTTPTNVLHREAGIPPVPLLLEGRRTALLRALKLSTKLTRSSSARRDQKLPSADCASAECIETRDEKFRDWLQALSPRTLVVYSDGSRSEEGHIGYGYAVHRDGSTVLSGKGRLGTAEVFDAEAKGNEEADALAKAGASLPEPADGEPTLAHLRKIARLQRKEAFSAWWETSAPERYRDLRLKATTSCLVTTMRD
ncbi:reverse transcriptase (RNA-dependent DNA polymerase) [Hirsutella rhossiliensis]